MLAAIQRAGDSHGLAARVYRTAAGHRAIVTSARFDAGAAPADTAATARYATCRYLTSVGGARVDPALEELIRYHDQETKATAALPMA